MKSNINTSYKPPFWQFNAHIQTIYPSLFRKIKVSYQRERVELPDGDFLDLDWSFCNEQFSINNNQISKKSEKSDSELVPLTQNTKLIIVSHGLEGDSQRHYVTGMIKKFNDNGWDGLAWNCRSCSGEMNRLPRFYHHGDTDDIHSVVNHAIEKYGYKEVVLVGFSMGGSMTARLIGEFPEKLPKEVKMGVAVSVPLDLFTSVYELYKFGRQFYMKRFIKKLGKKIKEKSNQYPDNELLNHQKYEKIKNFEQFDNRYTARMYGFQDAHDFYKKAGAKPFLKNIKIPTLIIQAINDPFLSPECLDLGEAANNPNLELILLKKGGHVGFMMPNSDETYVEKLVWERVLSNKF